jgi:hypothetical protein
MATDRLFNDMLNEHLTYDLLKAETLKRNWFLKNVSRDDGWKGGNLVIPFQGSRASTAKWGGLSGSADIDQHDYIRGNVSTQKEMWGSILFNHRDLIEHDGKVSEKSFLKVLPEVLDDFVMYIKERTSLNMLNGSADRAISTWAGANDGLIELEHPERLTIGEKVFVDDDDSVTSAAAYVRAINLNTGIVTLYDARSGGAVTDLTLYTGAQNAKIYFDGTEPGVDLGFTSLKSQILPASAGGTSSIFGVTKTAYPFTQSIVADGSAITEATLISSIFNHYVKVINRGSGNADTVVMSFKNLGAAMKSLENNPFGKGAYHIVQDSQKVTAYGWGEIKVMGPRGVLTLVGVQEQDDDVIYFLDLKSCKFHSNGFFRKRVAPDGKSYYEERNATGFTYIVDIALFGELVVSRPRNQGALYGVDITLSV